MAGGLAAGYGTFATLAARYLYPPQGGSTGWLFATELSRIKKGESFVFRSPAGASIVIARQSEVGKAEDFIALSSTCPHLGCQVHWEGQNNRFFCPCHNGSFDASGVATGGPPKDANQSLPRYPLKVEYGLLYIEVPLERVAAADGRSTGERAV